MLVIIRNISFISIIFFLNFHFQILLRKSYMTITIMQILKIRILENLKIIKGMDSGSINMQMDKPPQDYGKTIIWFWELINFRW